MNKVEKLSIALTPDMAAELRAAVDAGEYGSVSEAIREALRDWRRRRGIARDPAAEPVATTAPQTTEDALTRLRSRITRVVCPSCGDPKS